MPTPAQRFIYAIRTGNHERLQKLISEGGDISVQSAAGRTALHASAEEGDCEAARILLQAGADVNARMKNGLTPLHLAASYGGGCDLCDPDPDRRDPCNRNRHHSTNAEVARVITQIIQEKHPEIPPGIGPEDKLPEENKADMFLAVLDSFGNPEQLYQEIRSRGVEIDQLDPHLAERLKGNPRYRGMVELLLQHHADIHAVDDSGGTVLSGAVELGRPEMVELLLSRGAKLPAGLDEAGMSLIDSALESCRTEVADILLRYGATLDSNPWRLTEAAANGRLSVVQWLLEHGVGINSKDENGDTALIAAGGHHNVVACLLERHADPRVRNSRGRTVLHESACWSKSLELLLPLGLSINEADEEGGTPLHVAAQGADQLALKMLINAGASLDAQDHSGNTPLHILFYSEELRPDVEFPTFHALVAAGADRSIRNHEGHTAFDLAKMHQYPTEYLELLKSPRAGREHAQSFVWLGDDRYLDFLPKALVSFELNGKRWPSCDHYFHAQKTDDVEVRERVRQAKTVNAALCRLRELEVKPSRTWPGRCDKVMRLALLTKFRQNADLRQALLATGNATLVSDSSCDGYWFENQKAGFNDIGKMLMDIRTRLRGEGEGSQAEVGDGCARAKPEP